MSPLSVLMISSEAQPYAKTGGLADAVSAMALAIGRLGHAVALVLPRYRGVRPSGSGTAPRKLRLGWREFGITYHEDQLAERVRAILVDCPELYDRERLYGVGSTDYADNDVRFGVLARAALDWAAAQPERADIVHAHDWQGGLAPVYLRSRYRAQPVGQAATVFTIHNPAYQGLFATQSHGPLEIPSALVGVDGLEYWGKISFLKAGINFSDAITTVSPTFAREMLTPELGFGFDGILAARQDVLTGILNGIDTAEWNPATDRYLPAPYTLADLSGKHLAKLELLSQLGLPDDARIRERPIIAMISRMVDQKGFDLIDEIAEDIPKIAATWVVLGSGEPRYERLWQRLASEHPARIAVRIGFDEPLAHLIEGGADMFLMPSRFEPCGLNQMYSLRYGTVPIVRATGGLDDAVESYDPRTHTGTGFKFREYSGGALLEAIQAALRAFARPEVWEALQWQGMQQDFSWDVSAEAYVKVYRGAMDRRRE